MANPQFEGFGPLTELMSVTADLPLPDQLVHYTDAVSEERWPAILAAGPLSKEAVHAVVTSLRRRGFVVPQRSTARDTAGVDEGAANVQELVNQNYLRHALGHLRVNEQRPGTTGVRTTRQAARATPGVPDRDLYDPEDYEEEEEEALPRQGSIWDGYTSDEERKGPYPETVHPRFNGNMAQGPKVLTGIRFDHMTCTAFVNARKKWSCARNRHEAVVLARISDKMIEQHGLAFVISSYSNEIIMRRIMAIMKADRMGNKWHIARGYEEMAVDGDYMDPRAQASALRAAKHYATADTLSKRNGDGYDIDDY